MVIKYYKRITNLLSFLLGILIVMDILDYPFYFIEGYENRVPNEIIP